MSQNRSKQGDKQAVGPNSGLTLDDMPVTPSKSWRLVVAVAMFSIFFILDRIAKHVVLAAVSSGFVSVEVIPGILDFTFVANTGAAFGIGDGMGVVFVLLAAAVLVFTVWYLATTKLLSKLEVVGLGMVAAGALGNAIDRVVLGYVVDFFAVQFIDFPVFNVADIAVVCGVVIAFAGFLISPANKLDATAELKRRERVEEERRAAKRAARDSKRGK